MAEKSVDQYFLRTKTLLLQAEIRRRALQRFPLDMLQNVHQTLHFHEYETPSLKNVDFVVPAT